MEKLLGLADEMRTLELGRHRRARIWLNELPRVNYQPEKVLFHTLPAASGTLAPMRTAAVEVFVPVGPRSMYGMLGGSLKPKLGDELTISIAISSTHEPLMPDNLALKEDEVRVGLPVEYAPGIMRGLESAESETALSSGELIINCAAHGVVSSNITIFKHLTAILVKLLHLEASNTRDEDLLKLFPSVFD